jgi:hypothetical protein
VINPGFPNPVPAIRSDWRSKTWRLATGSEARRQTSSTRDRGRGVTARLWRVGGASQGATQAGRTRSRRRTGSLTAKVVSAPAHRSRAGRSMTGTPTHSPMAPQPARTSGSSSNQWQPPSHQEGECNRCRSSRPRQTPISPRAKSCVVSPAAMRAPARYRVAEGECRCELQH